MWKRRVTEPPFQRTLQVIDEERVLHRSSHLRMFYGTFIFMKLSMMQ